MLKISDHDIYSFLCALFAVLLVTMNLIYQKFVALPILSFYTFEISVGIIFYPLTFLITDLITEFFGKEKASFCIRMSIVINLIIAIIVTLMAKLEATAWSKVNNEMFLIVFGSYGTAFFGSIIANFIAQSVDVHLYLLARKLTKGKMLWFRSNLSTSISLFIDTSVVISMLTFFGALPKEQMVGLIFNSYLFKLLFAVSSTPLFYVAYYAIRHFKYHK